MRSARRAAVVSATLFAASVLVPARLAADVGDESQMLALVNELRARRGLAPLAVHDELRALANEWAVKMADSLAIFHSPLNTRVTSRWVSLGENVAVDLSVTAAAHALEASPSHLVNLVNPAFNYIGIGVARGRDGGVYVVQEFMQAGAAPPASAAPPGPPIRAEPVRVRQRPPVAPPPSVPRPAAAAAPAPVVAAAPPPPPEPSRRLAEVFGRLRDLDDATAR